MLVLLLCSPPLGAVQRLLSGNLLDKRRHRHALYYKTCARLMHSDQKLAPCIVDAGDLPHIEFDFFARTGRGSPDVFRFSHPGTTKSAREFQATLPPILMKRDS